MIITLSQTIESLVIDISTSKLLLPEMQRSYVWKSTQVRDLFDSLYHQYPSGQLLVWETDDQLLGNHAASIEDLPMQQHNPRLLLDGQQRLTSLTAIMLDQKLKMRDVTKEIDIAFNIFTEKFDVASSRHTAHNNWISLRRFFKEGSMSAFVELGFDPKTPEAKIVFERLSRLDNIKKYQYIVNVLVHLDYEEVTHIFVRTNSGGTTLSKADLALAQISSYWHGITHVFDDYQKQFKGKSWGLELDSSLLLRAMVALLTGQSRFSSLFRSSKRLELVEIQRAWARVKAALELSVAFLVQNCLIDHLEILPTRSILIPLIVFFDRYGNSMTNTQSQELQRWVYMALIWTRYSASSETAMDQDITALSKENPVQEMVKNIENEVGHRLVTEQDLQSQTKSSPFMVMSYVLARRSQAKDPFSGIAIGSDLSQEAFYLHHIFPKLVLAKNGVLDENSRAADQIANLIFIASPLTKKESNQAPSSYLAAIDQQRLKAQYIPLDRTLWELDQFENFVSQRRTMLAGAINHFFASLAGEIWPIVPANILETRIDALEHRLRKLIADRLRDARGDDAWDHLVSKEVRNSVNSRIKKQEDNKPFIQDQHETLEVKLTFCMYSDLFKIIESNWLLFQDVFVDQHNLAHHKQAIINARNNLAHNNTADAFDLSAAETALLWIEPCIERVEQMEVDSSADALVTNA